MAETLTPEDEGVLFAIAGEAEVSFGGRKAGDVA